MKTDYQNQCYEEAREWMAKVSRDSHGEYDFLDGDGIMCPWLVTTGRHSHERVVAFHCFPDIGIDSYVCWYHGQDVFLISQDEILPFLKGQLRVDHITGHAMQRTVRKQP